MPSRPPVTRTMTATLFNYITPQSLLDQLPCRVYVKDPLGRYMYANGASIAALGVRTPQEVIGKTDVDFFTHNPSGKSRQNEQEVITTRRPLRQERLEELWPSGDRKYVCSSKIPLLASDGTVVGLAGVTTDETAVTEQLTRYQLAVTNAEDGLFCRDLHSPLMWYSSRFQQMLGNTHAQDASENYVSAWRDRVHPEDYPRVRKTFWDHIHQRSSFFHCDYRLLHNDGTFRWIRSRARVVRQSGHTLFAGSHHDITEEKQKDEFFQQLLAILPAYVFVKNVHLKFVYANLALESKVRRALGRSLIGLSDKDIVSDPAQVRRFEEADRRVLRTQRATRIAEELLTLKGGRKEHLATVKTFLANGPWPPQDGPWVLGIATNLTSLKRKLADQELLLHGLLENIDDGIFLKDAKHRFKLANRALATRLGASAPDELIGKTDAKYLPPAVSESIRIEEARLLRTPSRMPPVLHATEDTAGHTSYRSVTRIPLWSPAGRIRGLLGISRDVTDLVEARHKQTRDKERLYAIIDHLPHCIWVKSSDGVYQMANRAFAERHGYTHPSQVIGKRDIDHWPAEEAIKYTAADQEALLKNAPTHRQERQYLHGQERILDTWRTPMHAADGTPVAVLGVYEDVTEKLEAERRQSNMELAREIGHSIRSWVGILQTRAHSIARQLGREHKDVSALMTACFYLTESAQIAGDFAAIDTTWELAEVDMVAIVKNVADLWGDSLVTMSSDCERVVVSAAEFHLLRALQELVSNAMSLGTEGEVHVHLTVCTGKRSVHLLIEDNGPGFAHIRRSRLRLEDIPHDPNKRTGIGLKYVTSVIKRLHARCRVEVPRKPGARIRICLKKGREP